MTHSDNDNRVEMHGCIVCAKIYQLLVVYASDGSRLDCIVTSSGGHCLPGTEQALVACDSHTPAEIDAAYTRWQTRNDEKPGNEHDDE